MRRKSAERRREQTVCRSGSARLLALTLLVACSCEKKAAPTPAAVSDAGDHAPDRAGAKAPVESADTSPTLGSPSLTGDASAEVGDASETPRWAFDCTDTSLPKTGKSIGHTSVVFKVELSNGRKAAWKPNAKRVKGRYKGEIAAYRLAQTLGLANVPPACFRAIDASAAAKTLAPNADAARLFAEEVLVEDGKVHGVVIPWIDGLSFWPLEKDPLRSEARSWLATGAEIPQAKASLAAQTSTLVVFDFLTGNWDRYSGENVGLDRTADLVLYIDNDAGFMEAPPKDRIARNKALLEATDRFSRRLVDRLRELDGERLAAAFGEETAGSPLLSRKVLSLVASRVEELLAIIDAKIAKRGEAETLYFP